MIQTVTKAKKNQKIILSFPEPVLKFQKDKVAIFFGNIINNLNNFTKNTQTLNFKS